MTIGNLDKAKIFHQGANTCRVTNFQGSPGTRNATFYRARLINLYQKELWLMYMVPDGKEPHQLLKDLNLLQKKKPWVEVWLDETPQRKDLVFSITKIVVFDHPTFEEVERLSLDLRNPALGKVIQSGFTKSEEIN